MNGNAEDEFTLQTACGVIVSPYALAFATPHCEVGGFCGTWCPCDRKVSSSRITPSLSRLLIEKYDLVRQLPRIQGLQRWWRYFFRCRRCGKWRERWLCFWRRVRKVELLLIGFSLRWRVRLRGIVVWCDRDAAQRKRIFALLKFDRERLSSSLPRYLFEPDTKH